MELTQIAQHVKDLGRARDFYAALLGDAAIATYDPPGLVFFRLGSTRLVLDRGAPSALIYLQVPDVRGRIEELRADGVEVNSEPHVIFQHQDSALGPVGTDECQAFIKDSEGNLVGLVTYYPSA